MILRTMTTALGIIMSLCIYAQNILSDDSISLPSISSERYIESVNSSVSNLQQKLDKKSEKVLQQFQKQEARIKRKLGKIDSVKAASIFADAEQQYQQLEQNIRINERIPYISSLDTLGSSLGFLQQNQEWLSQAKGTPQKLQEAISKVKALGHGFQKAEEIKKFLKARKQYLKEQLSQLGLAKELKRLNKQVYYYNEQLKEYKEMLKDHKKVEKKAIALLSKTKFFKEFMQRNSQLASLFRLPGNGDPMQPTLAGLQTRVQVNNLIQQQIATAGPGGMQQIQQNIQEAQGQLNQLKDKVLKLGGSSSNSAMPEGFKPNSQKTKSFLKRLEFGANIQSQKPRGLLPVTSDIGLSIGYKLNDKSIVGIGGSYKVGWGSDIRHIRISHQGLSLRSFVDWKLKGTFWLTGGYEMNYRAALENVEIPSMGTSGMVREADPWQRSGLIGFSKVISLKTKFFKKTKLQLLWDLLSYQQVPRTQPIVFRVGYNF